MYGRWWCGLEGYGCVGMSSRGMTITPNFARALVGTSRLSTSIRKHPVENRDLLVPHPTHNICRGCLTMTNLAKGVALRRIVPRQRGSTYTAEVVRTCRATRCALL